MNRFTRLFGKTFGFWLFWDKETSGEEGPWSSKNWPHFVWLAFCSQSYPLTNVWLGSEKLGTLEFSDDQSEVLGYFDYLHESFIGFLLNYSRVCLGNAKNLAMQSWGDFLCFHIEGSPSTFHCPHSPIWWPWCTLNAISSSKIVFTLTAFQVNLKTRDTS